MEGQHHARAGREPDADAPAEREGRPLRSPGLVGLLVLIGLAGLWWSLRGGERGTVLPVPPATDAAGHAPGRTPLGEIRPIGPGPEAAEPARKPEPERTAALVARAPRTRELVRGRLVIAGTGAPLDEVLKLRLRAGDVSVMEDLVTAPDGSFVSTTEFPRGLLLLKVFRPAGDQAADLEGAFDPAAPEEWIVPVPWPTFVHGTVLGRAGQGLPRVEVALVPHAGTGVAEGRTRGSPEHPSGEFKLQGLGTGRHTLHLRLGLETCEFEIDVARGPNELGELRTPFGEGSGEVSGRLIAPDGEPEALVLLVSESGDLTASVEADLDAAPEGESAFRFENVPPGRHRLELLACDGRRYEPAGLSISPPATDLVFRAAEGQERLRLQALDELGGELDTCGLVRLRGHWLMDQGSFARADVERWVVLASDRRPAAGERPERSEIRTPLAPGHGRAFLFVQAGRDTHWANGGGVRGRALAGVQVVADGRVVAKSDAEGLALVDLASAPQEVLFRLSGWRTVEQVQTWLLTSVALARE